MGGIEGVGVCVCVCVCVRGWVCVGVCAGEKDADICCCEPNGLNQQVSPFISTNSSHSKTVFISCRGKVWFVQFDLIIV